MADAIKVMPGARGRFYYKTGRKGSETFAAIGNVRVQRVYVDEKEGSPTEGEQVVDVLFPNGAKAGMGEVQTAVVVGAVPGHRVFMPQAVTVAQAAPRGRVQVAPESRPSVDPADVAALALRVLNLEDRLGQAEARVEELEKAEK